MMQDPSAPSASTGRIDTSAAPPKWRQVLDIVMMLARMSKLILNPKDISSIFRGGAFRYHRSFQLALASLHADAETHALITERYLAPAPYDLDALSQLPEGTLGRVFAEHMRFYRLEVVFYPPLEDKQDDDITYMRLRARQTHDVHHVVLGFPAIDRGEMQISAFYLAQNRIPLSALLLGIGFLRTILMEPQRIDELVTALIHGWTVGKQASRKFLGVRWEEYWELPIAEVRTLMGLDGLADPFEGEAATAGSPSAMAAGKA